ncbi:MAG: hypothetical protein GW890_05430, partial [Vibrio sp.]|nr:hypothetical protein [Vibrio sp.]
DAKNLVSQTASIKISGSGEGILNASEELNIEINGSGNVQYLGSPSINQKISGSGSVSQYKGVVDGEDKIEEFDENINAASE